VFGVVDDLASRGAQPVVHDPLYDDSELRLLGFKPYHLGEPCDAAVIQADHAEYTSLSTDQLGGATTIVDGRRILKSHPGLKVLLIGAPAQ
jgi:UDP-N-acetyl-D-mannosaminuronate dehydrogenase